MMPERNKAAHSAILFIAFLSFLLAVPFFADAGQILLKDGRTIEGDVIASDNDSLTVKTIFGNMEIDMAMLSEQSMKEYFPERIVKQEPPKPVQPVLSHEEVVPSASKEIPEKSSKEKPVQTGTTIFDKSIAWLQDHNISVDIISAVLIGLFVLIGLLKGFLLQLPFLGAFIISYIFPSLLVHPYTLLADKIGIAEKFTPYFAYFSSGFTVFLAAYLVLRLLIRHGFSKSLKSTKDRFLGGILGGVYGAAAVWLLLFLVHLGSSFHGESLNQQKTKGAAEFQKIQEFIEDSKSNKFYEKTAGAVTVTEKLDLLQSVVNLADDPKKLARFREYPDIKKFTLNEKFIAVSHDKDVIKAVEEKNYLNLLSNEKVLSLMRDTELFGELREINLSDALAYAETGKSEVYEDLN